VKASAGPKVDNLEPEVVIAQEIVAPAYRVIAERAVATGASMEIAYALALRVASDLDGPGCKVLTRCDLEGFEKILTIGKLCKLKAYSDSDCRTLANKAVTTFEELTCERFVGQLEAETS
jgi:hypothetical protein